MTIVIDTTSLPGVTIVRAGSSEEGIVIDYSSYYARIATALETIATNSTTISNNSTTISNNSTTLTNSVGSDSSTLSSTFLNISDNINVLKNLAEGPGIHAIGPYEYLGLIGTYKNLVEEGDILKTNTIQKSATKVAALRITEYLNIIKNLPKQF